MKKIAIILVTVIAIVGMCRLVYVWYFGSNFENPHAPYCDYTPGGMFGGLKESRQECSCFGSKEEVPRIPDGPRVTLCKGLIIDVRTLE